MQEEKANDVPVDTYEICKKISRAEIQRISNESPVFELLLSIYIRTSRKLVFAFYLLLVCVIHALSVELNRNNVNWLSCTIMELILLFIILFDILVLEYFLIRFKGIQINISIAIYFCLTITLIALKIWGPPQTNFSAIYAVNCIRIIVALFAVFFYDEKNAIIFGDIKEHINSVKAMDKILMDTQKPLNASIVIAKNSRRASLLKTPKRNSIELSETKIIEEVNNCIRQKVNSKLRNEIVINVTSIYQKLSENLDTILNDDFNIFTFDANCLKHSLYTLMNYYYRVYQLDQIKIPENKYLNLIWNIEKNYNENPYHSAIHASDVANTLYYIMEKLKVSEICEFNQLDKIVLLLSGVAHDLDHPGTNNMFEINTRSVLAITYNDKSVLENYHLYVLFNLLSNNFLNIFEHFDTNQVKNIRKIIIANIISTDMTFHKADVKKLSELLASPDFNPKKPDTKEYIMTHLTHLADISNPTKPFEVYNIWVDRIFEEFFAQGDKEKELGLPISMMCDRNTTKIPDCQIFFMNFFVKEELNLLITLCPQANCLMEALEENRKKFEELKKQSVK